MSGLNDLINESKAADLNPPPLNNVVGLTSNKQLMAQARLALSGNWGMGIVGYVLYYILAMAVSLFTMAATFFVATASAAGGIDSTGAVNLVEGVGQIASLLLSGAFVVGFYHYFLVISQEGEARLECLFTGFKRFWKSFGVYILYTVFILLWMLLLIIPGIIAAFSYAMAFFIIAEDADCGALEAIRRSKDMMKGNRWKLFCLHCRFIGWALLALFFTFGIGFLWLVPYLQTALAEFYEDVKDV